MILQKNIKIYLKGWDIKMNKILSAYASRKFKVLPDDRFIVSYPRSGQTWFRCLLQAVREPDLGWIDAHVNNRIPPVKEELCKGLSRPRIFTTHEYYNPKFQNIVYLMRDPRAVAMSEWNWRRHMPDYSKWKYHGDFDIKFIKKFTEGGIFPGCWEQHLKGWLMSDIEYNSKFVLKYENLYANTWEYLKRVCNFLDIKWSDDLLAIALKTFSPGKPKGFMAGQIKPIKASPDYWQVCYTPEMMELMNNRYKTMMQRFDYDWKMEPKVGPHACGVFSYFGQDVLAKELREFKELMQAHNIPFFLIGGCCLGLIREKKFLNHDKDMDIGIFEDVDLEKLKSILEKQYINVSIYGVDGGKIVWANKKINGFLLVFEIQVHYRSGNKFYMNRDMGKTFKKGGREGRMQWDHKFFNKLEVREFLSGERYNVPYLVEEYLDAQHGDDWRIPKEYVDWRYHANSLEEGWLK